MCELTAHVSNFETTENQNLSSCPLSFTGPQTFLSITAQGMARLTQPNLKRQIQMPQR